MIKTLCTLALLQGLDTNISPCGVCLKDFENAGYKKSYTNNDLYDLRKKWYIEVIDVSYPKGMRRFYHRITIKGKQALKIPLTAWEKFYLLFV